MFGKTGTARITAALVAFDDMKFTLTKGIEEAEREQEKINEQIEALRCQGIASLAAEVKARNVLAGIEKLLGGGQ